MKPFAQSLTSSDRAESLSDRDMHIAKSENPPIRRKARCISFEIFVGVSFSVRYITGIESPAIRLAAVIKSSVILSRPYPRDIFPARV